jgi:hypothetical protein
MTLATVGLDLGKNWIHLAGLDVTDGSVCVVASSGIACWR